MRVLVSGATGLAGSEVVQQCLLDPAIEEVVAIARRPLAESHAKLTVAVHENFLDFSAILDALARCDAWLWCLGIAQSKVDATEYERITYEYALAAAGAFAASRGNAGATFCFLSGQGADSKEKSFIRFARVKGKTENALLALGAPRVFCFRPGFIHSPAHMDGRGFGERVMGSLAPVLRAVSKSAMIDAAELAKAMIRVAKHGADKTILENRDILGLA